jgi:hypothetical protein
VIQIDPKTPIIRKNAFTDCEQYLYKDNQEQ